MNLNVESQAQLDQGNQRLRAFKAGRELRQLWLKVGLHLRELSMVKTEKRVDLKGRLKHTASSAKIKSDGSLVIELHDFSSEAEKWLGNEVAFLLKVSANDKSKMLSCLLGRQNQKLDESQGDDLLLQLIGERFTDYYEVKKWIEENKIPYEKEFDPWA